jgi:hypothetical protein
MAEGHAAESVVGQAAKERRRVSGR